MLCLAAVLAVLVVQAFIICVYGPMVGESPTMKDVASHFLSPSGAPLVLSYIVVYFLSGKMKPSYYEESSFDPRNVFLQLYVVDFFMFCAHYASHNKPFGSAVYKLTHAPHHIHKNPRMTDAFDGSLGDTTCMIVFPLFLTSRIIVASFLDYACFGACYSALLTLLHARSSHRWESTLVWTEMRLGTSEQHRLHHKTLTKKYGHIFSVWDTAFVGQTSA